MAANAEEIALDEEPAAAAAEEEAGRAVELEQLPVPAAVFGGIAAQAKAAAGGGEAEDEPQGAMARLKRLKK